MRVSVRKIVAPLCLLVVASCASTPPQSHSGQMEQAARSQSFAPSMVASDYGSNYPSSRRTKYNMPSAPLNTPLCGSSLQEQALTGQGIYSQSLSSGNNCALNACFQPLTGTYIAQTGNAVVCR
ncbi:hypothetical protein PT277_02935 [Acetobacteraceae bacterium ESL0709]|nr:hypothetical protein [Acetobacteraceae bacterium ESL0697]MDF7677656.1 hypothetical protein [Acetobacteraceae bacterium ESL0709]